MTPGTALHVVNEIFVAVEHCGCILTEIEVTPEVYNALKESDEFENGRLWTAKVIVSEDPHTQYCRVKKTVKPEDL